MNFLPHRPKFTEQFFFFFSGMVISTPFPILFISLFNNFLALNYTTFYANLISIIILAPILEEFAKAYPLFFRHGETERSILKLGFLTGLGFGIAEFFLYVFVLQAPIFLRLPALLFHASNTTIVAYGISKNKSFLFYLFAVGLHVLNNYSATVGQFWYIGSALAIIVSYLLAIYFYKKSTEKTIGFWTF